MRGSIQELITKSATPLKGHEETFAIDATGFSDSRFGQWQKHKYRDEDEHRLWKKLHISCGVRSNIVTTATVTKGTTHDQTQFEELVEMTDQYFDQGKVLADKAYNARVNYDKAKELGAKAYIPFKDNITGKAGGSYEWMRMYKRFQNYRRDFLKKYHLRSNVESSFNLMKEKFGKNLRCKDQVALETEVLAKVLCYNICTVIRMIYELDLQFQDY
ncbi:MAG: transposase [Candidatus Nanohaloarchaea archaeon]